MSSEETTITISIDFLDKKFAEILQKSLEPENKHVDDKSKIEMILENQKLLIKFSSLSSLPTIRNTIDDIFTTISTSENIYKTVKRKKN
ncbi:MAG: KEOPS complex subunit Pcc1 [Candidatus Heimdallarchaeaceae archaeon]